LKSKYLIIPIILSLIFISPVNAESCDTEDIERLTTIANHVDLSYTIEKYEDEEYSSDEYDMYIYNFKISNLTEELYLELNEQYNNFTYDYSDTKNGVLEQSYFFGGTFEIKIYSSTCSKKIRTINQTLPYYNQYYNSDKCQEEGYKDLTVCQEWTSNYIDSDAYQQGIEDYEKEQENNQDTNDLTSFIQDNFLYITIGGAITIILIIIVLLIIKRKRGELK
jgi:hypothetical protein